MKEPRNTKTQLQLLIQDLLYISESDNPLELLDWNVPDEETLLNRIAAFTGQSQDALQYLNPTSFFASIQMMADPDDDYMMDYAARFSALQKYLSGHVNNFRIIRAGLHHVHIFLTGITAEGEPVILHTLAIET